MLVFLVTIPILPEGPAKSHLIRTTHASLTLITQGLRSCVPGPGDKDQIFYLYSKQYYPHFAEKEAEAKREHGLSLAFGKRESWS